MAKPYQYPYPCEDLPRFSSQNDAYAFIEQFKKRGKIKNCSYLRVDYFEDSYGNSNHSPTCEKRSFKIEGEYRDYLFYGCPKDCRLYEPAWKGKTKRHLRATRRSIKGLGTWIVKLVSAVFGSTK